MSPTLTILLVGSLVAASCALVGSFLVLRRMSLLGDAISHAILPGVVIAFFLTGDRSTVAMLIGAGALGVLTVFLVESLTRSGRLAADASMGVVFPFLFAVGVILISRYADAVELDLDCVLYGEIAYAPWDTLLVAGRSLGPKALWVNSGVLLIDVVLVVLLFKELKVSTFDPGLSAALGFSPILIHYVLMSAVSVTVVGAFESVGAILVVAMLIVPPATAYLLTDRLGRMLVLAVVLGVTSAVGGYWLARWWDSSIAGAMAVAAGIQFLAAFLLSPKHGVVARLVLRRRIGSRLSGQLLMMHLANQERPVSLEILGERFHWNDRRMRRVTRRLDRSGLIEMRADGLSLTGPGHEEVLAAGGRDLAHKSNA